METPTNTPPLASRSALTRPLPKHSVMPSPEKAHRIIARLEEGKAADVLALDVTGKSSCMDIVIIASAKSARHARSLADALSELAAGENFEWLRLEGYQNGEWILADMNDVVVHIFQQDARELFQLENLWKTAPKLADRALPTPTLLLILDGYGITTPGAGNAASEAATPNIDRLLALPGRVQLAASGRAVGLPEGYMGNSEVGHLNIGAGRVVYQDMTRIDVAIETGEFAKNPAILGLFDTVAAKGGKVHLAGLLSNGGVHSHINHLEALIRLAAARGVQAVVHAFMDGRDTPPTSGAGFVRQLQTCLDETGARLGTLVGRFYAMDRDKRWERVQTAWNLLVHGEGQREDNPVAALEAAYAAGETDEFVKPRILGEPDDVCVRDGDGVFFINFRADRARELASAFADTFDGFDRGVRPATAGLLGMTSYDVALDMPVAFAKDNLSNTLGEAVAALGLRQLRIAETEKYAHVTYFFSGGREATFMGEDRILVNSPKDVATYDLKPQMSAIEVTDKLLEAWNKGLYSLVVCNLANPDMVGHTGVMDAAKTALVTVDACVGRLAAAVEASGGRLVLTADHGNVEQMLDPVTGQPHTAHTCNPVPLLVMDAGKPVALREDGKLGDIAPTILRLWGLPLPTGMTGTPLIDQGEAPA